MNSITIRTISLLTMVLLCSVIGCGGGGGDGGTQTQIIYDDNGLTRYNEEGYEDLFTHGNLTEVEIVISQQEWDAHIADMKEYMAEEVALGTASSRAYPLTGRYRRATFIYTDQDGQRTIINNVGFRTKGHVSRIVPQEIDNSGTHGAFHRAHFKVKFNAVLENDNGSKEFAEGSAEYLKRKDRRFAKLRSLIFRMNAFRQGLWDTSQIRELYAYDILNEANVETSRTGSAKLYITIDGVTTYFGIYTLIEPIDKSFLTKRYGKDENDGNLYKCLAGDSGPATLEPVDGTDGPGNIKGVFDEPRIIGVKDWKTHFRPTYDLKTNEEEADHRLLLSFINSLNTLTGDDFKAYIDDNFKVKQFLRYHAMHFLLAKWDDYGAMGNNYYLYFNNDGKIVFIPCDYDMALGQGASLSTFTSIDHINMGIYDWENIFNRYVAFSTGTDVGYFESLQPYNSPLLEKLLAVSDYRDQYEQYLQQFLLPENQLFLYSLYEQKYNQMAALYGPHLNNDVNEGETMNNLPAIKDYFHDKTASVVSQLGLDINDYETGP